MTNEEAIIDIRENIQPIIGGKSLDIAISAIEKQIHNEEAQAKIERLKESLNIELENFATEYDNKIKAEAVKEFADEFERRCIKGGIYPAFVKRQLENVKKEMVGEEK